MTITPKHICITGVSKGLGRALVAWFHQQGHQVTGVARNSKAIADLQQQPGPAEAFASLDVLDRPGLTQWASDVCERFGPPDLLLCNAGMIHPDAPFLGVPAEEFDRVQDVNLKGTANVIRAMLPSMMEARSGVIVGFSSGAGVKGYPEISGYCASKHAIEGLCKSLAQEVPDGMAVIPFQPGVIQTDMLKTHYGERAADYPTPEVWVQRAGPYLLSLGPEDNGQSLRLPDS
jgi:NAD(P)-dependent dehydrogenase (short-subunit alcohol dehydrogenase family)